MARGRLITFEGGEGSGKTTQIRLLHEALIAGGKPVIMTREPGGVESAERIRELLVKGTADAWLPKAETLLFYAARMEHVERKIRPEMNTGTHVLCDRFADSTIVYQGVAKNVSQEFIHSLHRLTLGEFVPDLTILLDIDPQEGLARARARSGGEERFEALSLSFHQKIREGFLALANGDSARFAVVDAAKDMTELQRDIRAVVHDRLGI